MGFSGNITSRDLTDLTGAPLRAPLKAVYTKPITKETEKEKDLDLRVIDVNGGDEEEENGGSICTTPTGEESRVVSSLGLTCPPAPRKRKAASKCNYVTGVKEFFNPPDLESVFVIRHVQRAK